MEGIEPIETGSTRLEGEIEMGEPIDTGVTKQQENTGMME
jgi:hypothetical protein